MEDFKSAASAIPPPRHVVRNPNSSKPFRFPLIINTVTFNTWCVEDAGPVYAAFSLELDYLADSINFTWPLSIMSRVTEPQISYSFTCKRWITLVHFFPLSVE